MEKVTIDPGITFQKAKSVHFPELLLQPFLQTVSQTSFKFGRHSVRLTRFVQSDAVADNGCGLKASSLRNKKNPKTMD